MKMKLVAYFAVFTVSGASAYGVTPSFQGLGDLPDGLFYSWGWGVSGDGSTAVGQGRLSSSWRAFRWTADEGMVDLGRRSSKAYDASTDGSVIVGNGSGTGALRWTADDGALGLGVLPGGSFSSARGVSADGSVVVGYGDSTSGTEAFRWTSGGMVGLGDLSGGDFYSTAQGVSADGSVVVGYSESASGPEAFHWTSGSMVGLGDLSGGGFKSRAYGVSADGLVVVGCSTSGQSGSSTEAFRWTAETGMVGLGFLPGEGNWTGAVDVSSDGAVIIGYSKASGSMSFLWDADNGMRNLKDVLVDECGLDLTGWFLGYAKGVSDDGRTIVGYGINPDGNYEAWMAVVPEPATLSLLALGGLTLIRRRKSRA